MKKALISSVEPCETGYRVAQVEPPESTFAVAVDLFWVDCEDHIVADQFWYDPADQIIKPIPTPEPVDAPESQSTGMQSF